MNILVLPGLDGSAAIRKEFVDALGAQAAAVDYPPDASLNYDGLSDIVCSQQKPHDSYLLVAESFSGPVAIRVAQKATRQIAGVVFVASFAKMRGASLRYFSKASIAVRNPLAARAAAGALGWGMSDAAQKQLAGVMMNLPTEVITSRILQALTVNDLDRVSALQLPMLYLQARRDFLMGDGALRAMIKANPDIKHVWIEGPHFLLGACPEECASIVKDFADRLSPA